MTPQYTDTHIDLYNTLMMEYASGVLNEMHSLMIASHLTLSPQARRHMALCECLGGMMIGNQCQPVEMRPDSLRAVLDRLDDTAAAPAPCTDAKSHGALKEIPVPQPICHYISANVTRRKVRWHYSYPGIRILRVDDGHTRQKAILAQMKPSARAPAHVHAKTEITLVLHGALIDESGIHRRGDLLIMDPGTAHHPRACPEQGCLCFVVYDASPRFSGALGAILNLFSRL